MGVVFLVPAVKKKKNSYDWKIKLLQSIHHVKRQTKPWEVLYWSVSDKKNESRVPCLRVFRGLSYQKSRSSSSCSSHNHQERDYLKRKWRKWNDKWNHQSTELHKIHIKHDIIPCLQKVAKVLSEITQEYCYDSYVKTQFFVEVIFLVDANINKEVGILSVKCLSFQESDTRNVRNVTSISQSSLIWNNQTCHWMFLKVFKIRLLAYSKLLALPPALKWKPA